MYSRQTEKHALAKEAESGCTLEESIWCLPCSLSLLSKSKRFHSCLQLIGSEVLTQRESHFGD